jgi:hypothetical protein
VIAGTSPGGMVPVAHAARSGFETAISLPAGTVGPYLAVQALYAAGRPLGVSQPASESGLAVAG